MTGPGCRGSGIATSPQLELALRYRLQAEGAVAGACRTITGGYLSPGGPRLAVDPSAREPSEHRQPMAEEFSPTEQTILDDLVRRRITSFSRPPWMQRHRATAISAEARRLIAALPAVPIESAAPRQDLLQRRHARSNAWRARPGQDSRGGSRRTPHMPHASGRQEIERGGVPWGGSRDLRQVCRNARPITHSPWPWSRTPEDDWPGGSASLTARRESGRPTRHGRVAESVG